MITSKLLNSIPALKSSGLPTLRMIFQLLAKSCLIWSCPAHLPTPWSHLTIPGLLPTSGLLHMLFPQHEMLLPAPLVDHYPLGLSSSVSSSRDLLWPPLLTLDLPYYYFFFFVQNIYPMYKDFLSFFIFNGINSIRVKTYVSYLLLYPQYQTQALINIQIHDRKKNSKS